MVINQVIRWCGKQGNSISTHALKQISRSLVRTARAETLGRLEVPMIAAALPVAEFVVVAGAVEEEIGRW